MDREGGKLINQLLWSSLHKENRHRPKYPIDEVVRFIFRNFKRDGSEKVLDLGCGAGRHVFFMASENLVPFGLDFSSEGVEYTKSVLKEMDMDGYAENIKTGSAAEIPFEDEAFDGVLCIGVLYYMRAADIKRTVSEIHRVLRDGGKALIIVRSTEDYRCQSPNAAPTDEHNTIIVGENDVGRSASREKGMLMHFFEREEIEAMFKDFHSLTIDRVTVTHENETYADDDYLITCVK